MDSRTSQEEEDELQPSGELPLADDALGSLPLTAVFVFGSDESRCCCCCDWFSVLSFGAEGYCMLILIGVMTGVCCCWGNVP